MLSLQPSTAADLGGAECSGLVADLAAMAAYAAEASAAGAGSSGGSCSPAGGRRPHALLLPLVRRRSSCDDGNLRSPVSRRKQHVPLRAPDE